MACRTLFAILCLQASCAPAPPTVAAPVIRPQAERDAPLPDSWRLGPENSFDSLACRIYAPSRMQIEADIGPMAATFREPSREKCRWIVAGQDPDWFAFTERSEPEEVQLLIRNEKPEGGAYSFRFTPRNADQVAPVLEQLLASHEWIRARLLESP